jgi:hypothetical protein
MEWRFVEAGEFTRRIVKHGLADEFARAQEELRGDPRLGMVEPGTCGLRKLRMGDSTPRPGRRPAARIHYVVIPREAAIYLVGVSRTETKPAFTPEQKRELCSRLRTWGAK